MRRVILFLPLVLFALLAAFLWKGLSLDPKELPSALIGKPFPAFNIPSLQQPDKLLTRENLLGKPLLVNVWATWCPACRQEHEQLLAIAREGRIGIIGLNYKDERASAIEWLEKLGDPYLFNIYDENGMLGLDLGVYGAPETYLLDAQGIVLFRHVGVVTPEIWTAIKTRLDDLPNPG